jgi:hypothetical protein
VEPLIRERLAVDKLSVISRIAEKWPIPKTRYPRFIHVEPVNCFEKIEFL